jgi:polyhydroxybutyrate depolymerase
MNREYILYVPENYSADEAVPLLINYHGYTASALIQVAFGDFRPIADTSGFLVVHPQGTLDNFGNTHWNVGIGNSDVDDVGFTVALIDSLSAAYNIDQKRVYAAGMSNGGFMSYKLGCELHDRIAAIASVTGSMRKELMDNCSPAPPVPVMEIHGTADPTVPFEGGFLTESIPDVLAHWVEVNSCNPDPTITDVPDTDPNDGSTVEHHVWPDGEEGASVELFKVIGGGHTWPGTVLGGTTTNYDIDASEEIWKFFSRYDIDGLILYPGIEHRNELPETILVYPNPANTFINFSNSRICRVSKWI